MQLLCVGDIAIGNDGSLKRSWNPPNGIIPGRDSQVLFNWELPIGSVLNPIPRKSGPRLLSHPNSIQVIQKWAPGIAALATNHVLDAGKTGLIGTVDQLTKAGFVTTGAGCTFDVIRAPLFWETKEGRLAIINWVFPEAHPDWMCEPGPNCFPGIEEAQQIIRDLKLQADWVMVVGHWSDEDFAYPLPEDRQIAHNLAEAGTDIFVCHHPHAVRGMETIGSCLVFYSLGNFYFSNYPDGKGGWITRQSPRNREGLGVTIHFQRGSRPAYEIHSFWQTAGRVVHDPFRRAARRFKSVSRPIQRYHDSDYAAWYTARKARFDLWEYRLFFRVWRIGMGDLKRYWRNLYSSLLRKTR